MTLKKTRNDKNYTEKSKLLMIILKNYELFVFVPCILYKIKNKEK